HAVCFHTGALRQLKTRTRNVTAKTVHSFITFVNAQESKLSRFCS
ncbi:hypothetical protein pipiens_019575, partial [Culex pipiens pipiens]